MLFRKCTQVLKVKILIMQYGLLQGVNYYVLCYWIIITDVLMDEQNLVTSGSKIIKTHTIKPPSLYP